MFKLIELLRSKPSDRTIRIIRTLLALILLGVIYFGFTKTDFSYYPIWPDWWMKAKIIPHSLLYFLYIFPAIWLIRGLFDPGVFRKKIWKWTQVGIGVTMMLVSFFLIETDTSVPNPVIQSTSRWLSAVDLNAEKPVQKGGVDTDFWIGFFGIFVTLLGLFFTSKNITTKNERYGEIVKKIRV